jgi:hypothetical protein
MGVPSDPSSWTIFIPLASALSGAAIGAFGSQFFAARNKERDDLLKEVRSANSACTIAYSITDSFITMKRDIVKPTVDRFTQAKERFELAFKNYIPGVSAPVDIPFDLQTFTPLRTASSHLQDIVFRGISAPVRAVSAMAILDRAIAGLHDFHLARNALCEEFRLKGPKPDAFAYFGIKKGDATDERLASILRSIDTYTDDVIFLSKLLGDDLRKYANDLKAKLPKRLKDKAPVITSADFSIASDILPDPTKYEHWQTMFVSIKRSEGLNFWKPQDPSEVA